ncbi:MAG TPA: hypothetical protein VLJ38_05135 [Polyangiaceae bacterium]|nr:hypothetical protein [Polyangiaceae bacterium]
MLGRGLLVLAFAGAKLDALWGKRPLHSGDQFWWDQIGRLSLGDRGFWLAERPFTVPLLHKLAGFSEPRVILLQGLLDVLAWVTLAHVVSRLIRPLGPKLFAFGLLLGLGLTSGVQGWNAVMRSESASNSFLVLTLAAMLATLHAGLRQSAKAHETSCEPRTHRSTLAWAGLTLTSAVLAAFARDNDAYALVLVSLFAPLGLLAAGLRPRAARRELLAALTLSGGLLLIAAAARTNAEAARRYEWPLMNVIFQRVLPSRAHTAYFEHELGMPISPALLGRKRRFMSADGWYAAKAPELAPFRDWLLTRGYAGYQRYLLAHLAPTTRAAWQNFANVAGDVENRHTKRTANALSWDLDRLLVDPWAMSPGLSVLALTTLGILGLLVPLAEFRLLSAFSLLCLSLALTQAYVCYHADAMEVARHSVNVGLCLRLSGATTLAALTWFAVLAAAKRTGNASATPGVDLGGLGRKSTRG